MVSRFDQIASFYEKAHALYPNARTDAEPLLKLLDLKGDEAVLEVACGTGYLTQKLAVILLGGKIVAEDISPRMMAFAKERVQNLSNVSFLLCNDSSLAEIDDSSFDKAVCLGGFHHIEDPVKVFHALKRVLKLGGVFAVGDFADCSPVQRYFDEKVHYLTDTGHAGFFLSESRMENLGRIANLETVSITRVSVPFVFSSPKDVGIFYKLAHCLKQKPAETRKDIEKYMGIREDGGKFAVPMDYIYAAYRKRENL